MYPAMLEVANNILENGRSLNLKSLYEYFKLLNSFLVLNMISPQKFVDALNDNDINFVTGVPDSLLKEVACITWQFSQITRNSCQ